MIKSGRVQSLDIIKGLAIIAVVLYHTFGGYGYLGVDVFLVVAGFFMMKGILKDIQSNKYSYFKTIRKNILRLYPLLLITVIATILTGLFVMLPDDLENLGQSAVASSLFANNILSMITTKNYWDVVNEYKPLMHTWYLGVLFQIYAVFPIIITFVWKKIKNLKRFLTVYTIILFCLSLVLYLLPVFSDNLKFYFFPFRIFEVLAGAIIALFTGRIKLKNNVLITVSEVFIAIIISLLMFINVEFSSPSFRLLSVVILTCVFVFISSNKTEISYKPLEPLAIIGRASYSIFLWHQPILALFRYCFKFEINLLNIIVFLLLLTVVSIPSYLLIENKLVSFLKTEKKKWTAFFLCAAFGVFVCVGGFILNYEGGVIRDVPELGISVNDVKKVDHGAYCDRVYDLDQDFESDRTRILVVGDSFGRDWANILMESDIGDEIEISYIFPSSDEDILSRGNRFDEADYVFYALSSTTTKVSEITQKLADPSKFYVVGSKNFGENNGYIYNKRNSENYFNLSVEIDKEYVENNNSLKILYKDHYIDMLTPVMVNNSSVRVFTDDNKYISQDCRHLTQYGAKYYADILDFSDWFVSY